MTESAINEINTEEVTNPDVILENSIENTLSDTEAILHDDATEKEKANTPEAESSEDFNETEALKNEISELRKKLEAKEKEQETILSELGEFERLFPETSVKSVPDEVWKKVEGGVPLCAAYALYEREKNLARNHANEINARNSSLAAGKAGKGASEEYFSPEEVKRMSQREVHRNFSKIKNSMKYWH